MSSSGDDCYSYTNTASILNKARNTIKDSNVAMGTLLGDPSLYSQKSKGSKRKIEESQLPEISIIYEKDNNKVDLISSSSLDTSDVVEINDDSNLQEVSIEPAANNCINQLSVSCSDIGGLLSNIDACIENCKSKKRKGKTRVKKKKSPAKSRRSARRNRGRCNYDDEQDSNLPPLFAKNENIIDLNSDNEDQSTSTNLDEVNPFVTVKIWWRIQDVHKFQIRKFQKLDSIFAFYVQREDITEDKLMFTLNDRIVKKTDTPDSLNLAATSLIEGGVLSKSLDLPNSLPAKREKDGTEMEFKIQQNDRKKTISMGMKKADVMGILFAKIAEELKLPLESFKLYFDGDVINPKQKPADLELEGGECLDLKIL